MKIYIAHSRDFNYQEELYKPIREDKYLKQFEIILPHEYSDKNSNTRDFYKTIDIFIADVSSPATGLGIELGWAFDDKKEIICIHKENSKVSGSISAVTNRIISYKDTKDMVEIIKQIIKERE